MPCYDPETTSTPWIERLNARTDQLCRTLAKIEEMEPEIYTFLPADVLEWHQQHKKFDEERKK